MSSIVTGSAKDLTGRPEDCRRLSLMQQTFDHLNPNVGWIIGPVAMATAWIEANVVQVDLSWAEMLYSIAAVLYAIAAVIKSLREKNQTSSTHQETSKNSQLTGEQEDTIDVR
jgi:hypothetical protein